MMDFVSSLLLKLYLNRRQLFARSKINSVGLENENILTLKKGNNLQEGRFKNHVHLTNKKCDSQGQVG